MVANIEQLVTRNIQRWERQRNESSSSSFDHPFPTISISRKYGADEQNIVDRVADELELPLYDKQLVEHISTAADVRQQLVESLDAKVRDNITNWIHEQFDHGSFTHSDYLAHLTRVVLSVARKEKAVIVGRGAHFILDPQYTLRVRLVANLSDRTKRVAEAEETTVEKAAETIAQTDAERAAYCRLHFKHDLNDASHYDLVLNTSRYPSSFCAEEIVRCYQQAFRHIG